MAAGQTTSADGSGLWRTAADVRNSGGRAEDGGGRRRLRVAVVSMIWRNKINYSVCGWVVVIFLYFTRVFTHAFTRFLPAAQNTTKQNPGKFTRG